MCGTLDFNRPVLPVDRGPVMRAPRTPHTCAWRAGEDLAVRTPLCDLVAGVPQANRKLYVYKGPVQEGPMRVVHATDGQVDKGTPVADNEDLGTRYDGRREAIFRMQGTVGSVNLELEAWSL